MSLLAILLCLAQTAGVRAQGSSMGSMGLPTGSIAGAGQARRPVEVGIAINESFLGFIDSAVPRSTTGGRFDITYNNTQPMRAEYVFAKGGVPGGRGFPLPETRVDYQDLTSFAEYSWTPWFSVFVEGSYRWLNPTINDNHSGTTDMRYGLKLVTWSDEQMIATILLRLYSPSRTNFGTQHWSIEPGLLLAYRIMPQLQVEGEFRYWVPLGGTDFQGDILRYGVGVSYGQRKSGFWVVPVLEGIGWSVLSGKTMVASSASSFEVLDAHGATIVNAYLGARMGYGSHIDGYVGYGRAFTGDAWQRDIFRLEFRYIY